MTLVFRVYGVAQAKGSTRAFGFIAKDPVTGRQQMRKTKDGRIVPVIRTATSSDNPSLKGWQNFVAEAAHRALLEQPDGTRGPLEFGVRVTLAFFLPRPKKYQRRGVDVPHLTKPDIDKLVRACLDALKGVAWIDDSQVVELLTTKQYAAVDDAPHVDLRVEATAGVRPVVAPAAPLPLLEGSLL